MKTLLGAHVSYKKSTQLLGSVKDLLEIGANSGAFYISPSRGYIKNEIDLENVKIAKEIAIKNNFNLENIIVHSPLVGNLANCDIDSDIYEKTFESYYEDLIRLNQSGIKYYNFHPGSYHDEIKGINKISYSINKLHLKTKNHNTIILLETTTGKGNYIGKSFEQLSKIIKLIDDKNRIGICLDTCHVWDAGYDIKNNLEGVLNEFDKIIGLNYLKALHINDSKNERGSNKDRHESIGKGYIGEKALKEVVNHPKLKHLPKALETPYDSDNFERWKYEINLLINK